MGNERLTVGLLLNSLDYGYQASLLSGLRAAAKAAGVNTVCFVGAELNTPDPDRICRNPIFDLVSAKNVDGVIVLASATCGFLNPRELEAFAARFGGMPAVSLGMPLKGVPSIVVDNRGGMREAVDHLIEAHGIRKMLYLSGPEADREALERLEGFRDSLRSHGIPDDPARVRRADFFLRSAQLAVLDFLEAGGEAEAIIAPSDNMAIGALRALQERGLSAPEATAVTGFDDIEGAASLAPPLTTVRQPLAAMAEKALENVLKIIGGQKVPELETLATSLVVRRSCGCLPGQVEGRRYRIADGFREGPPDFGRIKDSLAEAAAGGALAREELERYGAAVELARDRLERGSDEAAYAKAFDRLLRRPTGKKFDDEGWDEYLSLLRRVAGPHYARDAARSAEFEDLVHLSRILVKDAAKHAEADARTKIAQRARTLQKVLGEMINSFDPGLLFERMADGLPLLGIASCYLSLHASDEARFKDARLVFAFDGRGRIDAGEGGAAFPAEQLFPRSLIGLEGRFDLVVEALAFRERQMGFMVLGLDPREGILVTSISDQVRGALRASMLMRELSEKGARLERALESLRSNQERLLISEKMASLGRLTSGIAHEMNSPLAAARASLSVAQGFIAEYRMSLDNPAIKADDHRKISDDMARAVFLADKAIEQATVFIRSIKAQTSASGGKEGTLFDLADLCKKALLLLGFALKRASLSVDFRFPGRPVSLRGRPDMMLQAINGLLLNAIEAMEGKTGETIALVLDEDEASVTLKVEDRGRGIPRANLSRIFDPLFTTKPFGDSAGLGLTIIHDIVYGEFNGTIDVKSVEGEGSSFTLVFGKGPPGEESRQSSAVRSQFPT